MKFNFLIMLLFVGIAACAHKVTRPQATSPVEEAKTADKAHPVEKPKPKPVENLDLRNLDSVATALRAVYDQSLLSPSPRIPSLLACDIAGEEAMSMMMPLKARMDERIPRELKDYIRAPRQYAKDNNFAKCQLTCHCGLYASLLNDAVVESTDENWHRSQLRTLRRKASKQTLEETNACARAQSWFCESSLRQELLEEVY